MTTVLLIAPTTSDPLPSLTLLPYELVVRSARDQILTDSADVDLVVIDARAKLASAKAVCAMFQSAGVDIPRLVILSEGGLATYSDQWGCDDFAVDSVSPAELDARIKILLATDEAAGGTVEVGDLIIDEAGYSATLDGQPLELTYTEFELLKYLATHPGRVFSREQLLAEVWGYDYYGGTRTVDVHVRRLRAKLGPEYESFIGTVRNVGYRFTPKQ